MNMKLNQLENLISKTNWHFRRVTYIINKLPLIISHNDRILVYARVYCWKIYDQFKWNTIYSPQKVALKGKILIYTDFFIRTVIMTMYHVKLPDKDEVYAVASAFVTTRTQEHRIISHC